MRVDVVVCAHNEQDTVAAVLAAIRQAPELGHLIVVADACNDATVARARGFAHCIVEIGARDKGSAMEAGLRQVETKNVLFVDADISGLTHHHVSALMTATPEWGQIVGLRDGWPVAFGRFPPVTGERRVPTQLAIEADVAGTSWRAELRINAAAAKAGVPWSHYVLNGVKNPRRVKVKEYVELAGAVSKNAPALLRYAAAARRVS